MRPLLLLLVASSCRVAFDRVTDGPSADDTGDVPPSEVEIVVEGHGIAIVEGEAPCTGTCRYTTGPLEITAQAGEAWQLESFGAPCLAPPSCTAPLGARVLVKFARAPITANVVFVSSRNVGMTGLASIDAECASLASAAGFPGTFVAWVSTSTIDARSRVGAARGWVRSDGLPVLDTMNDIASYVKPRGVVVDEYGAVPSNYFVITASTSAGLKTTGHCSNWTASTGPADGAVSDQTGERTLSFASSPCGPQRVYCIQTDRTVPVILQPPPLAAGRYIFLGTTPFVPTGAAAAADSQCQGEATQAGLPGAYRALIATTTESAATRVGGIGGLWRRSDGVAVAWNGLDAPALDAAIIRRADGTLPSMYYSEWLGAANLQVTGTPNGTCQDWTSTTASSPEVTSVLSLTALVRTGSASNCGLTGMLLCAQLP